MTDELVTLRDTIPLIREIVCDDRFSNDNSLKPIQDSIVSISTKLEDELTELYNHILVVEDTFLHGDIPSTIENLRLMLSSISHEIYINRQMISHWKSLMSFLDENDSAKELWDEMIAESRNYHAGSNNTP